MSGSMAEIVIHIDWNHSGAKFKSNKYKATWVTVTAQ